MLTEQQCSKFRNLGYVGSVIKAFERNSPAYPKFNKTFDGCYACMAWVQSELISVGYNPADGYWEWTELIRDYLTPGHEQIDRALATMIQG